MSCQRKLFQWNWNVRRKSVAMMGMDSGTMMVLKTCHSPAPSILAASRSSEGIVIMYCLIRKRPKTFARCGMIIAL